MSNLKGAILAMALWVGVVFPFLLSFGIDSLQQRAYLSTTEKIAELLKQEGGVSEQVQQVANNLKGKGYIVTFSKPSLVQFGEEIVINYQYEYQNVRGKQKLATQNKVVIDKRIVAGGGNPTTPKEPQTYSVTTPESLNANGEFTFNIPGLKNILNVTSNTGNVEIVRVNGEEVTARVSNGAISKKVQTGGAFIPADTKFVRVTEKRSSPRVAKYLNYNQDGYVGKLQYVGYSGTAPSKQVTGDNLCIHLVAGSFSFYVYKDGDWTRTSGTTACSNTVFKYKETDPNGVTWVGDLIDYVDTFFDEPKYVYRSGESSLELLNGVEYPNKPDLNSIVPNPKNGDTLEILATKGIRKFTGIVYDNSKGNPSWDYEGYVTRSESDTRTYANYYQYQLQFEYMSN
nr:hypothetical protein [uncultured Lysinibacillus sp.]